MRLTCLHTWRRAPATLFKLHTPGACPCPLSQSPLQVVVDTEQTAKALLANGQLRNRVTIIPLNKVGGGVGGGGMVLEGSRRGRSAVGGTGASQVPLFPCRVLHALWGPSKLSEPAAPCL